MLLYELHNAVSRTIGDPVENTGSLFVDGVRYSTRLRAQYMWQAMNDIVNGAIVRVASAPHAVQSEILERLFPSMVREFTSLLPIPADDIVFVLSGYYTVGNTIKITLPIVKSFKAMQTGFGRNTGVQPSDPFIVQRNNSVVQVVGVNQEDISMTLVTINALCRPPHHEWFSNQANASENTTEVFEGFWLPEVIRRVSLMAQLDSGELGKTSEAYPLIATPSFASLQQG